MTTWVVVANRVRARLFEVGDSRRLAEIEDLVHPEARERERELVDDRRGREAGEWGRQTFEPRTSPEEKETHEFVTEIGRRLERAADAGAFDRLVLCAGPRMLGRLRGGLPDKVTRRVVGEVEKDLANALRPEEIAPYLGDLV